MGWSKKQLPPEKVQCNTSKRIPCHACLEERSVRPVVETHKKRRNVAEKNRKPVGLRVFPMVSLFLGGCFFYEDQFSKKPSRSPWFPNPVGWVDKAAQPPSWLTPLWFGENNTENRDLFFWVAPHLKGSGLGKNRKGWVEQVIFFWRYLELYIYIYVYIYI